MDNKPNQTTKYNAPKIVRRSFKMLDLRATNIADDGPAKLEGHAAVFDSMTNIGGYFNEIIARGAFDGCNFDDVLFFINHDMSKVPLARSRRNNSSSTMQLAIDNTGLFVSADLDVDNNSEAKRVHSSVQRGDISGMSFCFAVADDNWTDLDTDTPTRTINKVAKVFEVSAVNFPAYDLTDINARDKQVLDNAKLALDNARSQELDNSNELDIYKLKNKILGSL